MYVRIYSLYFFRERNLQTKNYMLFLITRKNTSKNTFRRDYIDIEENYECEWNIVNDINKHIYLIIIIRKQSMYVMHFTSELRFKIKIDKQ
jgi:hypothetical protein